MKYTVRNADGELEYESFKQLEEAHDVGFIDPDDQVRKEGQPDWVAARTLLKVRHKVPTWRSAQLLWVYLALALATGSIALLTLGYLIYGALAIFPLVMVLLKVTKDAASIRRR